MAQKRNDLGYLGEAFQYRLTHEFMENHTFFEDLSSIIDQNMFTDPNLKTLVGVMKNYYEREGHVPSYDMMEVELRDISHSEKETETYLAILEKVHSCASDGVDRIRELAEKFFRQQNIIKTANEILKIAGNGDTKRYEECVGLLNDAMYKGVHNDFGEGVFDHINETLSDDYRVPIPTGIDKIDETLEGGLGKGELGVIIAPSGIGKAQPLTSKVLTPDGYKLMGDMKVGDYVMGCDGDIHEVIGVFPQGKRPIYKVTLSNGAFCECDIEHLWNVNSLRQRDKTTHKNGKRVKIPDYSFKTVTLREILSDGIKRRNELNFRVPIPSPMNFPQKELLIDPYLMGYFIGDGNIERAEITIGDNDFKNVRANFNNLINEADIHYFFRESKKCWSADIVGESKKVIKSYFPNRMVSEDKEIPNEYLYSSLEDRIKLLQGLMDSDGYCMQQGTAEYLSKSKKLAEQVCFLVRSLGCFATIKSKKISYFNKKYNKIIDCGFAYRVTITLMDDSFDLFRLERKQKRVKPRSKYKKNLYIKDVEYLREDEAQCIYVDSDEHLYITDNFIVTHNSSMTTAMASHAALNGFKVLQIIFEDRIKQIQRKHIGRLTNIESKDLSKKENIDYVKEVIEKYKEDGTLQKNLRIVKFPSGEKTARQIKAFILKLINNGFKPDLVIIDYFECLAHESDRNSTNEFEKEGKTMRFFEAMVGELDIALWIPSQGTKDSINLELITMDKIGGSVKKAQIAHIILSIARTVDDIANNKATIAILKNRAGKSGKVFNNVGFNNGTCRISTDEVDECDSLFEMNEKKKEANFELQKDIMRSITKKGN